MVLKVYRKIFQQVMDTVKIKQMFFNTGHFTFWGHRTKATVTIVCIGRFNWNLALWLTMDNALLQLNFASIRYCLLELRKYTKRFCVFLCKAILVTKIFCYEYSTIKNSAQEWHFSMKFNDHLSYLLETMFAKFFSDSSSFDIFNVQCLGGYFFLDTM